MVHLLLDYGADPNAPFKGTTPLLYTANLMNSLDGRYENTIAIAYLLIKHGADFDARNTQGRRAVNSAPNGVLKDFLLFVQRSQQPLRLAANPIVAKSKPSAKKPSAKKPSAKKTAAKKQSAKKLPAKKSATKKTGTKQRTAKKTAAKKYVKRTQ